MRKLFRRMLGGGAALLAGSLTGGTWIYTQHPKFGKLPDGARLDTIKRSRNYSGDGFQNLIPTPVLADDRSFVSVGIGYLFAKKDRPVPTLPIPSVKTDLQSLDRNRDVFVWLGHSSYFIQLGGKRILFDPVFSASPDSSPTAIATQLRSVTRGKASVASFCHSFLSVTVKLIEPPDEVDLVWG